MKRDNTLRRHLVQIGIIVFILLITGPSCTRDGKTPTEVRWQFNYDTAGYLIKTMDLGARETRIHYERDEKQRVRQVTKDLPDASKIVLEIDPFGRRVRMADAVGTVRYEYDGFDRLTAVYRDGSPSISYTYDTMGRLDSVHVGDRLTTGYAYDFLGRLTKIDTPVGSILYEYQSSRGTVIRTLPNGIRTIWEYHPDGNLHTISHVAADNRILGQLTYSYRPDGLISGIKEWSFRGEKLVLYEYDTVQRLAAVTDSQGGKISYRYDPLGNLIEVRPSDGQATLSSYDWAGRLLSHTTAKRLHMTPWGISGATTAGTGTGPLYITGRICSQRHRRAKAKWSTSMMETPPWLPEQLMVERRLSFPIPSPMSGVLYWPKVLRRNRRSTSGKGTHSWLRLQTGRWNSSYMITSAPSAR